MINAIPPNCIEKTWHLEGSVKFYIIYLDAQYHNVYMGHII